MKNMAPNRANMSRMTSTTPADRDAERNSRSGSSGWRARDWRMTNSSPSSAAAPRKAKVRAEPQAKSGPLIRAHIRANNDQMGPLQLRRDGRGSHIETADE